jgi:hypothetical protein
MIYLDKATGNPSSLINTENPDTYLRIFFSEDEPI